MPQRTVAVASRVGLHARPAAMLAQAAAATGLAVTISVGDRPAVDAASTLMIMTLGARQGDEVTLSAEGEGADEALDSLVEIVATDLDEEAPA